METKEPVKAKESLSSATRSYAAVVQSGPAVPSKVKKGETIATMYSLSQGRTGIEVSSFG